MEKIGNNQFLIHKNIRVVMRTFRSRPSSSTTIPSPLFQRFRRCSAAVPHRKKLSKFSDHSLKVCFWVPMNVDKNHLFDTFINKLSKNLMYFGHKNSLVLETSLFIGWQSLLSHSFTFCFWQNKPHCCNLENNFFHFNKISTENSIKNSDQERKNMKLGFFEF